MPYLLPSGDAFVSAWRYYLVAVPDDEAYIRAAMGAYTEFSKWYVWERDDAGGARAAADSWDLAIAETLRLLEMGFPDILLSHIDEVEALLRALRVVQQFDICCPSVTTTPAPTTLDTTTDDVPDPIQGGYGTGNDWPTAQELYLCPALNTVWGNLVPNFFDPLSTLINAGGIGIAALAGLYAAWAGILGVLVIGLEIGALIALLQDLAEAGSSLVFGDYESDLDVGRIPWVCAVKDQTTAASMKAASDSAIDALEDTSTTTKFVLKAVLTEQVFATILNGEDGEGNPVIVEPGGGCPECGEEPEDPPPAAMNCEFRVTQSGGFIDLATTNFAEAEDVFSWTPYVAGGQRVTSTTPHGERIRIRFDAIGAATTRRQIKFRVDNIVSGAKHPSAAWFMRVRNTGDVVQYQSLTPPANGTIIDDAYDIEIWADASVDLVFSFTAIEDS